MSMLDAAVYNVVIPAWQEGAPADRFVVMAFLARKDNRGNLRTFRYLSEHKTVKDARKAYEKRVNSGKYLYGALVEVATLEALESFGDESAEERWLDDNQD